MLRKVFLQILKKERGEVKDVILTEYNAERHIKNEKKRSYEEGRKRNKRRNREGNREGDRKRLGTGDKGVIAGGGGADRENNYNI